MARYYNLIAGQSLERLAALSDGVFAIAMTLLVLDLHVPEAGHEIVSEGDLWRALLILTPRFVTYFMSFLTLGIFWVGQQTQLQYIRQSDRNYAWIHLGFLLSVTLMPFSTGFLSEFIGFRISLVLYWLNIFLMGLMLYLALRYAAHAELFKKEVVEEVEPLESHRPPAFLQRRIVVAQALYAFGALLCVFNPYVSIIFIIVVQLNYVFAPHLPLLHRL